MPKPKHKTEAEQKASSVTGVDPLLVAVARCFRSYGYAGTTTAKLSRATGLSLTELRKRFPGGKQALAIAALELGDNALVGGLRHILNSSGSAETRLGEASALIDKTYMHGELGCLLAAFASLDTPEVVRTRALRLQDSWLSVLAEFYRGLGLPSPHRLAVERLATLQGSLILSAISRDPSHLECALFQFHADAHKQASKSGVNRRTFVGTTR